MATLNDSQKASLKNVFEAYGYNVQFIETGMIASIEGKLPRTFLSEELLGILDAIKPKKNNSLPSQFKG